MSVWQLIENRMKCKIPFYLKNILKLQGFDNILSIKTLTDEDFKSLETFARTKLMKLIPDGSNLQHYYHVFAKDPEAFEILPGHIRLLNEIIGHAIAMATTLHDDDAISNVEANHSSYDSAEAKNGGSVNETAVDCKENCNGFTAELRDELCKTQCDDEPQPNDNPKTQYDVNCMDTETFKGQILCGSPRQFYILLDSSLSELNHLWVCMEFADAWPILEKVEVGQMCAALCDETYYRAKVLSIGATGPIVHYIDYGNESSSPALRKLPENLQKIKPLAMSCSLESQNGTFSPELTEQFAALSREVTYAFQFVSKSANPAIVKLLEINEICESDSNERIEAMTIDESEKQFEDIVRSTKEFDAIIETMSTLVEHNLSTHQVEAQSAEMPKFLEPAYLKDDEYVVIRYIETPKSFWVQQTKTIFEYNALMDKLCRSCKTAASVMKPEIGMACAVFYENDNEWYRGEIVNINEGNALTRFVDYGVDITTEISNLKEIDKESLMLPQQAIRCCLLGFDAVEIIKTTSCDQLEFIAEDSTGERRNFRVKIHGNVGGSILVNLIDSSEVPTLDVSRRMLQLSLSRNEFQKMTGYVVQRVEMPRGPERPYDERAEGPIASNTVAIKDATFEKKPTTNEQIGVTTVKEVTQPTTEPENTQTASQQLTPLDNQISVQFSTTSTKTKAIISHIDRPDRFYLQISSTKDALYQLQDNIQIVAPSLPPLEDFSKDTRCIVRYSVDNQWYRAVIIDSDMKITSILFIDYGNTDSITDNSLIKSMSDAFDQIPAYAIPCALPLEARDRIECCEESCDLFKNLVNMDDELEFEFVCKGKSNNFVKLYQGDRDVMQEFIQNGHAVKLDSITSGAKCYISHVNSISDFYIQMESDYDVIEKLSDYLHDASKFEVMTDVKEGVVCSAKYVLDGAWYRGKIMSHKADTTETLFIDYGNASVTNELRIIPTEIANAPAIAKYCSLVKPKDIQYWSESAERRFVELTNNGAVFEVDVISPGKKSVVDLISNDLSIVEEISNLCDKYTVSALEKTLQSSADTSVTRETFKATIVDGAPHQFYIQLESTSSELDKLWVSMEPASTWPTLEMVEVGQMCAALYDGSYYRAKALSVDANGVTVHYIDYGNQSLCSDLRKLPEDLQNIKPLAIRCSLGSKYAMFTRDEIERFKNLSRDLPHDFTFISKDSDQAIVQLFVDGVLFTQKPFDLKDDRILLISGMEETKFKEDITTSDEADLQL